MPLARKLRLLLNVRLIRTMSGAGGGARVPRARGLLQTASTFKICMGRVWPQQVDLWV
jgi:hypothetical protein